MLNIIIILDSDDKQLEFGCLIVVVLLSIFDFASMLLPLVVLGPLFGVEFVFTLTSKFFREVVLAIVGRPLFAPFVVESLALLDVAKDVIATCCFFCIQSRLDLLVIRMASWWRVFTAGVVENTEWVHFTWLRDAFLSFLIVVVLDVVLLVPLIVGVDTLWSTLPLAVPEFDISQIQGRFLSHAFYMICSMCL